MKTPERETSYDEQFNPIARRIEYVRRSIAVRLKQILNRPEHILVEMRWWLGDEIMALPVYEALRRAHPTARITLWTNYPELFAGSMQVDAVNVPVRGVDRYVLLRGVPRDVHRTDAYATRAGIGEALARPRLDVTVWTSPLNDRLPPGAGPLVAVAPGASWPTKRWPAENWRALCVALEAMGARVVELGNANESIGASHSIAGMTSVYDAAVILAQTDLVIAHDSGLMHLGLAVGTPVVALFGPTAPEILIRDEDDFIALETQRDCAGCWNRSQTMTTPGVCPKNIDDCMATITVEDVVRAAEQLALGSWKQCVSFF